MERHRFDFKKIPSDGWGAPCLVLAAVEFHESFVSRILSITRVDCNRSVLCDPDQESIPLHHSRSIINEAAANTESIIMFVSLAREVWHIVMIDVMT